MTALDTFITDNGQALFEWGKNDCVHFAARWVHISTGTDHLILAPKWTNFRSARRAMKDLGGLESIVTSVLGAPTKDSPRDGDIALLPDKLGGLCIVYGAYVVGPSVTGGLAFFSFIDAHKFWRLPCQMPQKS